MAEAVKRYASATWPSSRGRVRPPDQLDTMVRAIIETAAGASMEEVIAEAACSSPGHEGHRPPAASMIGPVAAFTIDPPLRNLQLSPALRGG